MKSKRCLPPLSCLFFLQAQDFLGESNAVPVGKTKTSDFFDENIRTLEAKHPYFCPKKSDVLLLPDNCLSLLSTKKVF